MRRRGPTLVGTPKYLLFIYSLCTELKHECVCFYKFKKLIIKSSKLEEVTTSIFQSRIEAGRKE